MRPPYDDSDEFDFGDSLAVRRVIREQKREEIRLAKRRAGRHGPSTRDPFDDLGDDVSFDTTDDFDAYEDYDEDEFDSYSDISIDH